MAEPPLGSVADALKGMGVSDLGMLFARQGRLPLVLEQLAELATEVPLDVELFYHCQAVFEAGLLDLATAARTGDVAAMARIAEIRDAADRVAGTMQLPIGLVLEILELFTGADIEAPGEWAAMVRRSLEQRPEPELPADALRDSNQVLQHLVDLAAGDPFDLHDGLKKALAVFPEEHRSAVTGDLAGSGNPVAQAAAIGFLLDPDPRLGQAVLSRLTARPPDKPVSPLLTERLAILKSWMPAEQSQLVDAAITALRVGAVPARFVAPAAIRSSMATLCDGAGAQSFFFLIDDERGITLASVLVKIDAGVADAWLSDALAKREALVLLKAIKDETMAVPTSLEAFRTRVRHALSVNLKGGRPPPFRLLQVVERLGAGLLEPLAASPSRAVEDLLAKVPEDSRGPRATRAAHQAARSWPQRYPLTNGWFEMGDQVETICQRNPDWRSRVAAIKSECVASRRGFWAEQCAWSALVLAAANKPGWLHFALVARDLELGGDDVPLLEVIARQTVARHAEMRAATTDAPHRFH